MTGPGDRPAVKALAKALLLHQKTDIFIVQWTNVYPSGNSFDMTIHYNRLTGTVKEVMDSGSYYYHKGAE